MPKPKNHQKNSRFTYIAGMGSLMIVGSLWSQVGCDSQVGPDFLGEPIASIRGVVSSENDVIQEDETIEVAVAWLGCADPEHCDLRLISEVYYGSASAEEETNPCFDRCDDLPECASILKQEGWEKWTCEPYFQCYAECGGRAGMTIDFAGPWSKQFISQEVEVKVELPSKFVLDIYKAPVPEAIIGFDVKLGIGVVIAKTAGGEIELDPDSGPSGPLKGVAEKQVILYTEETIEASSFLSRFLKLGQSLEPGFHVLDYEYRECPEIPFPDELNGTIVQCGNVVAVSSEGLDTPIEVTMGEISEMEVPFLYRPDGPR